LCARPNAPAPAARARFARPFDRPFDRRPRQIREILGAGLDYPLIWTADFILDTNADGSDAYR
jgi:hypothetical protein